MLSNPFFRALKESLPGPDDGITVARAKQRWFAARTFTLKIQTRLVQADEALRKAQSVSDPRAVSVAKAAFQRAETDLRKATADEREAKAAIAAAEREELVPRPGLATSRRR